MRWKAFLLLLVIQMLPWHVNTLRAQIQSSCDASAAFLAAYDKEIKFLALEWMYYRHSPDTALIDIPLSQQTPVREGLSAIFNTGSMLRADSVFSLYCIETDPIYRASSYEVQVLVDTSFGWTHNWLSSQTATGVVLLDKTLDQYSFGVTDHQLSSQGNFMVILRTHKAINTRALADSLRSFPGILYAGPGTDLSVPSPLNRISYTVDPDNGRHFSCRLGWGNLNYLYWNYKVKPGCIVELESTSQYSSEPLPPLKNCNLVPTAIQAVTPLQALKLYPNPAAEYLEWAAVAIKSPATYRIFDGAGSVVLTGSAAGRSRIHIASLPQGLYYVDIIAGGGERYGARFMKE